MKRWISYRLAFTRVVCIEQAIANCVILFLQFTVCNASSITPHVLFSRICCCNLFYCHE